jgi:hypothetical protein
VCVQSSIEGNHLPAQRTLGEAEGQKDKNMRNSNTSLPPGPYKATY